MHTATELHAPPASAVAPRQRPLRRAVLAAAVLTAAIGCSGATTADGARAPSAVTPAAAAPAQSPAAAPTTATSAAKQEEAPAVDLLDSIDPAARRYVDAVNAQDLDALVAAFAPDATIIDVSRRIVGADAIRTWAAREVVGGTLDVLDNRPDETGTALLVHWAPRGSAGWRANYRFEIGDGRITLADLQYA